MLQTRNRLRSALFVVLALCLALGTLAGAHPAPAQTTAAAVTCTPWRFIGCCPMFQKHEMRTCTDSTGVSFTETQCVPTPECV